MYVRGKFTHLGLYRPERNRLLKPLWGKYALQSTEDVIDAFHLFYQLPEREFQLTACDLLSQYKQFVNTEFMPSLEYGITHKCWWYAPFRPLPDAPRTCDA